jgi:uncharacterized protein (DUF1501 family)
MPTTRRTFLKTSLGATTLLSMFPAAPSLLARAALAGPTQRGKEDTILVVVQLAGGNDGLNTVVPHADDHYARNRHTLRLHVKELQKIDASLGFHPGMPAVARLFHEQLLTVVQGVGYPNPNQAHETSMRIWQTGHPSEPACETGWLGRAADLLYRSGKADVPAAFIGQIPLPFTLNAQTAIIPSAVSLKDCLLRSLPGPGAETLDLASVAQLSRRERADALLEFMQQSTAASYAMHRKLAEAARKPANVEYPSLGLAQSLRAVAQGIRAEVGVRIFMTELGGAEPGGFDNHANQRDNHASLLRQLSQSLAAFVEDLRRDRLLDRVLLMTYSEFGRTLAENGRRGTDHGSAAPVFLTGGRLKGGLVGPHPTLDTIENGGGVKHHTDFRRLYATLLDGWLGLDSLTILGGRFDPLDLIRG